MNLTILKGRLVADPEITQSNGGTLIARYRLAVNRRFKKEGQPESDFINCVCFGKTAEFVQKHLNKGKEILIRGSIQTGSYTNNEGEKRYTTDIIVEEHEFCGKKDDAVVLTPEEARDVFAELKKENDEFMPVDDDDDALPWS